MHQAEQQERLSHTATAAKPISWGRHGYSDDSAVRLRTTTKGLSPKLGSNAAGDINVAGKQETCSLPIISPMGLRSLFMMLGAPSLSTLFVYSCDKYQCALAPGVRDILASAQDLHGVYDVLTWGLSPLRWFTWKAFAIYMVWYSIQAIMYAFVPSKIGYGQKTLAGRELPYKVRRSSCIEKLVLMCGF